MQRAFTDFIYERAHRGLTIGRVWVALCDNSTGTRADTLAHYADAYMARHSLPSSAWNLDIVTNTTVNPLTALTHKS